jgi:WD40 repeat protein
MAISPDGKLLLVCGWGRGKQVTLPDGRMRYVADEDHPLSLWSLETGKQVKELMLPGRTAGPVAFSEDGKVFATCVGRQRSVIRRWDVQSGAELPAITGFRSYADALAFSPDGKRLVAGMADAYGLVWDLTKVGGKDR